MTQSGNQPPAMAHPLNRRRISGMFTVLALAVLVYLAVQFARTGILLFTTSRWVGELFFLASALTLSGAALAIFTLLRRKWKTGSFFLTPAEVQAKQAEVWRNFGAGKPFLPQAKYWIVPLVLVSALLGLGIAALVASACKCSDGSGLDLRLRMLLWALAAALMALPAWFLFKAISRKTKTGSFLPSQDELAKARAKCAAPKSMKQRVLSAALYWLVAIVWTIPLIIGHRRTDAQIFSPWFLASLWWFVAAIWTWQVFRPTTPHCALSPLPEEQLGQPEPHP